MLGIAYHDVEDRDPDQAVVAVRTERMIEQLAWLRENDYKPVTVDQIMAARNGGPELPPKAVLLSFDDGYSSFYTRVLPVLRAYNWHCIAGAGRDLGRHAAEPTGGFRRHAAQAFGLPDLGSGAGSLQVRTGGNRCAHRCQSQRCAGQPPGQPAAGRRDPSLRSGHQTL